MSSSGYQCCTIPENSELIFTLGIQSFIAPGSIHLSPSAHFALCVLVLLQLQNLFPLIQTQGGQIRGGVVFSLQNQFASLEVIQLRGSGNRCIWKITANMVYALPNKINSCACYMLVSALLYM